jgi:hypothetical protein
MLQSSETCKICICISAEDDPIALTRCLNSVCRIDLPVNCLLNIIVFDTAKTPQVAVRTIVDTFVARGNTHPFQLVHKPVHDDIAKCMAFIWGALNFDADWITALSENEAVSRDWLINQLPGRLTGSAADSIRI